MKKLILLLIMTGTFAVSAMAQQAKPQPVKKSSGAKPVGSTNISKTVPAPASSATAKKKGSTSTKSAPEKMSPVKTAGVTEPKTTPFTSKENQSATEVKQPANAEDLNKPLAVYVKDTATKFVTGTLKMGDEYISSRYTPPTITLLYINDLFDRDKKEMGNDDFMADKLNIGDKFYLNQHTISAEKKKELLADIQSEAGSKILKKIYNGNTLNQMSKTALWKDSTFSIKRESGGIEPNSSIFGGLGFKRKKSKEPRQLNLNDSLGNAILYVLLKKDIPAMTMKVWCDPKAVLQKSKDLLTTADLAVNKDPKKKLIYQELLKQNFILVIGFSNVHEIYEDIVSKDSKGNNVVVGKKPTGSYAGDLRTFLYKIEMNPVTISNLGSNCDTRRIPVRYAYRYYVPNFYMGAKDYTVDKRKFVNGSFVVVKEEVHLTDKEFNESVLNSASESIIEELESEIDEFKMRSAVTQVKPFTSEMGEKQGVYVDQRFGIYRYEKDVEKNEVNAVRVATVRMTKVAKNSVGTHNSSSIKNKLSGLGSRGLFKNATQTTENAAVAIQIADKQLLKSGQSAGKDSASKWSRFKPITSGNIQKGDFLLQNDDQGLSIQAGYYTSNLFPALSIGLEANLNVLFKRKTPPSGLKIGALLNAITNDYTFSYINDEGQEKETNLFYTVYAAKDFYLTGIVDVSPFIGMDFVGGRKGMRIGTQVPVNLYKGRVKLAPQIFFQNITYEELSVYRTCFGVSTKYDF